ncbi:hypothetical protein ACFFX1_00490 [Dactylosporangium sucinum]|uniref:DUF916 domain-containing protein n=1 Tax=Dactylosporangium sucinum TaxID=1424081 RepID=A0A917WPL9_9ACTN|nr:hypothetical protein [Dactylosporangium sucinum]GGM21381.1 hypothetical protein GCM10007977_023100 [Dactylosporangium sucinum]
MRKIRLVLAVLVAVLGAPAQAARAEPAKGDVTWSVVPATAAGPDSRRVIDLALAGGAKVTEHVAVTNHSARPVAFTVDANDGYLTAGGLFDMRAADVTPTDGGSWITVPDTVTVAGGATAVIPVVIAVPANATPGDHPAGVTASLDTAAGQVRVQNRVGVRINLRVTGALDARLTVADVRATHHRSWNPFAAGALDVRYTVSNPGNVRAAADTRVTTAHLFGRRTWTDPSSARVREVFPGGTREFSTRLTGRWPLGRISTTVTVSASADGATAAAPAEVTVTGWALPIPQLLLVLALVLPALAARTWLRRRRARLERLLARARAEGRAEAAGSA